jgi:hypothetical protein
MVFPHQLVETVANVLGVPTQTVSQHDRILALKGLRKRGGRGRSSAKVTPVDAANLIIAVVGASISGPVVRDTAINFERYAGLSAKFDSVHNDGGSWSSDLKVMQGLGAGHSFRDALAALISAFSETRMETTEVFRQAYDEPFKITGEVRIFVELRAPLPEAAISIEGDAIDPTLACPDAHPTEYLRNQYSEKLFYRESIPDQSDEEAITDWLTAQSRQYRGDLFQIRTITEKTIAEVAGLWKQDVGNIK